MLTQHIALVPEADGLPASELSRVSAALQKQITRDLMPLWGISATVDAFPSLEDVPVGYFPIIVTLCELGSEAGVHIDDSGQPFAQVEAKGHWSLHASRFCLQMLVNPYGRRTVTAASPRSDQGPVEFLVDVCGPCEDIANAYAINDVLVSDFCTPAYFGATSATEGTRFSATGRVSAAFQVLPGGHITWHDSISAAWWQRSHWGDTPTDTKLGSLRALARSAAPTPSLLTSDVSERKLSRHEASRDHAARASSVRALRLRTQLGVSLDDHDTSFRDVVPSRITRSVPPPLPSQPPKPEVLRLTPIVEHVEPTARHAPSFPPVSTPARAPQHGSSRFALVALSGVVLFGLGWSIHSSRSASSVPRASHAPVAAAQPQLPVNVASTPEPARAIAAVPSAMPTQPPTPTLPPTPAAEPAPVEPVAAAATPRVERPHRTRKTAHEIKVASGLQAVRDAEPPAPSDAIDDLIDTRR